MKNILVLLISILSFPSFAQRAEDLYQVELKTQNGAITYNLQDGSFEIPLNSPPVLNQLKEFKGEIFFSAGLNNTTCFGVEKDPLFPQRKVTMVPCNSQNGDQIVWLSNGDGTLRPLEEPGHCLTNLGWNYGLEQSFTIEKCNNSANQIWVYDPRSKAIVNTRNKPKVGKDAAIDRYGRVIAYSFKGGRIQQWYTASQAIKDLEGDKQALRFPIKLYPDRGGNLIEPNSVKEERMKIGLNNILAAHHQIPYQRDFNTYPGAIKAKANPKTKRINFDLNFDAQGRRLIKNWKSTGLYALPGQVITLSSNNRVPVNIEIAFNAHTDNLAVDQPNIKGEGDYKRSPVVASRASVRLQKGKKVQVMNDIGGLIYLKHNRKINLNLEVTIDGAVPAPYYNGSQSQEEWSRLSRNPVPWGEIEGKYFVVILWRSRSKGSGRWLDEESLNFRG